MQEHLCAKESSRALVEEASETFRCDDIHTDHCAHVRLHWSHAIILQRSGLAMRLAAVQQLLLHPFLCGKFGKLVQLKGKFLKQAYAWK